MLDGMATTPVPVSSPHGSATAGTELAESPLEIACDESGSEGDHLIGAETTVFAYASVRLDTASAAACVQQLRDRIGSPAQEYKAGTCCGKRAGLPWCGCSGRPGRSAAAPTST